MVMDTGEREGEGVEGRVVGTAGSCGTGYEWDGGGPPSSAVLVRLVMSVMLVKRVPIYCRVRVRGE